VYSNKEDYDIIILLEYLLTQLKALICNICYLGVDLLNTIT